MKEMSNEELIKRVIENSGVIYPHQYFKDAYNELLSRLTTGEEAAKKVAELGKCHYELLTIHNILMCPAECPAVADEDTHTIKLLKGLILNYIRTRLAQQEKV